MREIIFLMAATTGLFLTSIWLKELVGLGISLLTMKHFHFTCKNIDLFGLKFDKHDGKWERTFFKPAPLCQYNLTVDTSRPIPPDLDKKEKQLMAIRVGTQLAAAVLLLVACRGCVVRSVRLEGSLLDALLASTAVGMVFHSLVSVGIAIYTYTVMMKKLGGYVDSLIKRLRAGTRFADMDLRPLEELPFKNPTKIEIMMYYNFYLYYLLDTGNIAGMQKPIQEMTAYFRNREFIIQETMSYYWLIFYYSRFELNPQLARLFVDRIMTTISKDKDANGRRVLAYYAFGIERDIPRARELMQEGFAALDKFSMGAEREMERKLLEELRMHLDTAEVAWYSGE